MQESLSSLIDRRAISLEDKVIAWRRDIHQNPELSFHEKRTSELVADHLLSLGLEVIRGVSHHGVIGLLRGGKPGPVVALRADMDALPVTEETGLPFASKVKVLLEGKEEGVMHACGHDAHTAILLGVAETLAGIREEISGTVKFLFQPAEEYASDERASGASLMIQEKALEDPAPAAIFGLHVTPEESGKIFFRPKAILAGGSKLTIKVRGVQTHGAEPWRGVDPIVIAAQIVLALQAIVSRQINTVKNPAIITIGSIHGGNRSNIIPEEVEMIGTIRSFSEEMQQDISQRIRQTAKGIAESWGAAAEVLIAPGCPVTYNDPLLTEEMLPTLERVAGTERVFLTPPNTASEDFAFYCQQIPGMFIFLGAAPKEVPPHLVAPNHSPRFTIDEGALTLGVRLLSHLAFDYLKKL